MVTEFIWSPDGKGDLRTLVGGAGGHRQVRAPEAIMPTFR